MITVKIVSSGDFLHVLLNEEQVLWASYVAISKSYLAHRCFSIVCQVLKLTGHKRLPPKQKLPIGTIEQAEFE